MMGQQLTSQHTLVHYAVAGKKETVAGELSQRLIREFENVTGDKFIARNQNSCFMLFPPSTNQVSGTYSNPFAEQIRYTQISRFLSAVSLSNLPFNETHS